MCKLVYKRVTRVDGQVETYMTKTVTKGLQFETLFDLQNLFYYFKNWIYALLTHFKS